MKHWITVSILLLLFPMLAYSQGVTTSTLRGTVTDVSGETLPGANVVAVHEPSGTQYGTTTNESGRYTLANLRVGGPYTVTATFVGYQGKRETGIRLALGETRNISFELQQRTEELEGVEVVAQAGAIFSRENSGIGTNVSEAEIAATPTLDRSIADFTRLTPQAYVVNDDDDGAAISVAGQNNRYNSIFIDGAVSNDVFGLAAQGTDGGQTGASPISIDAIEQFEIDISPFDVTQSFFGGAAINAVTRSGTNEFQGSFAYERRDDNLAQDLPEFSNNRYVGRLGGPIIEDKLFFFVNFDILRSENPQPFPGFGEYRGAATEADLNNLSEFLNTAYGYNPLDFGTKATTLDSDKFLGKIDWNITQNHRLSARYSYSGSENIDAFRSGTGTINFASRNEVFPNDTHIAALELNSSIGNRYANKLIATYKSVTDDRGINGAFFPTVNIEDGDGSIQLGPEPFSTANLLEQEVFTVTNNFNVFLGDHTLTLGTHNEFYDLGNLFIPFNFGWYFYEDTDEEGEAGFGTGLDEFQQSVCASLENPSSVAQCAQFGPNPTPADVDFFQRGFSLVDNQVGDDSEAIGAFNAYILGFYLQDEWQVNDRLRVTAGLRVDIPKISTDPNFAPDVFNTTIPALQEFYSLNGAQPGQTPDAVPHWAPRLGFNFDAFGDQRTQVRGGVGVYTSRQPFVWPGGMFLNNGTNTGIVQAFDEIPFRADPANGLTVADVSDRTADDLIPSGRLEIFEERYKLPRFLRYALGVDQQLPFGIVGTLEGQYTNTLQNILVTNINLRPPNATLDGPDNRPIYNYDEVLIDDRYSNIHRVGNTSEGYSYDVTARVRKTFGDVFTDRSALSVDVSYTWGDSWVINDATSSQINSLWDGVEHVNGANNLSLSRSDFSIGHRIRGFVTYRQQFLENFAARLSLLYTGESGRPFSYIIDDSDDLVGENGDPNSLLYVPRATGELTFTTTRVDGVDITPEQQAAALDQFIRENEYLSRKRGDYTDRNGDRTPWEGVVDLNTSLQVFGDLVGDQRQLEFTFDIFNFSSLLGEWLGYDDWGVRYFGNSQFDVLTFDSFVDPDGEDDDPTNDFVPVYQANIVNVANDEFAGAISEDEVFERIETASTYSSQWQMRFGVRLTF